MSKNNGVLALLSKHCALLLRAWVLTLSSLFPNNRCLGKGSTFTYKPNHWMTTKVVSNTEDDKWTVCVAILSQEIQFTIDKGAKCNTLILDNYQHWCTLVNWDPPKIPMLHSNHIIEPGWCSGSYSPAQELKHRCWIWNCQPGSREYAQWGGKTTEALGLIARGDRLLQMTLKQSTNNVPKDYSWGSRWFPWTDTKYTDTVSQIQCQNKKVWCIWCGTNNRVTYMTTKSYRSHKKRLWTNTLKWKIHTSLRLSNPLNGCSYMWKSVFA